MRNLGQVLTYREIGDPILKVVCKPISIGMCKDQTSDAIELQKIIADLKATFNYDSPTGVGIAAPQIGYDKRVIIIGVKAEESSYLKVKDVPLTIMVNPEITYFSKEEATEYEGCWSVPGIRGMVSRSVKIFVEFFDEHLNKERWSVEDFTARLIQHECDHLDGITFLQRVTDPSTYVTNNNYKRFIKTKIL